MKLILIIPDGLADNPQADLGNKTPLDAANTPTLDALAGAGMVGRARLLGEGVTPDTSLALMALMGYAGQKITGRGYYEALERGIELSADEWAARCQLVTTDGAAIIDPNGGKTSTSEARQLMQLLNEEVGIEGVKFHFGNRSNHIVTCRGDLPERGELPGPWEVLKKPFAEYFPGSDTALGQLMARTREVLSAAEVNVTRRELEENEANLAYIYGAGKPVAYASLEDIVGGKCAMISYSPMARGMAAAVKVSTVIAPDEAGEGWEELRHLAIHGKKALAECQLVMIHVSFPNKYSDKRGAEGKVDGIQRIDEYLLAPVVKAAQDAGETRVAVVPSLVSDSATRQQLAEAVPFVAWGPGVSSNGAKRFTEADADATGLTWTADSDGIVRPIFTL